MQDVALKVAVVMSVFNGAKYLREQIDSILGQRGVALSLYVWDDGSTDNSADILRSYGDRLSFWSGPNQGAAQGFLQAVQLCGADADYYAFSDADDVWLPTKLADAIHEMVSYAPSGPAVIATRMTLTDAELNPIGLTPPPRIPFSFANALVQGGIGGASCVMNRPLWLLFKSKRPRVLVMHDGWLYLVASAFGQIFFSDKSGILYRQHGNNVMGAAHGPKAQWKRRLNWLLAKGDRQKDQSREFLRLYGSELVPEKREVAERFAYHDTSVMRRLAFAFNPSVQFNSFKSRVLYAARATLGRT